MSCTLPMLDQTGNYQQEHASTTDILNHDIIECAKMVLCR